MASSMPPRSRTCSNVGKESIQDLMDKFKAKIITIDDKPKIFEARYEVIKYQGEFKHPEAKLRDMDNPIGWADFLGGSPMEWLRSWRSFFQSPPSRRNIRLRTARGLRRRRFPMIYSAVMTRSKPPTIISSSRKIGATPYRMEWRSWILPSGGNGLDSLSRKSLRSGPSPESSWHSGFRCSRTSLGGDQEWSPFLSSGFWFDTLYYTGAKVIEVQEEDDTRPFKIYKVRWRGKGQS